MQVTFKFHPKATTGEWSSNLYKRVKIADAVEAKAEVVAVPAVTDDQGNVTQAAVAGHPATEYKPPTYEYRVFNMEFEFEYDVDNWGNIEPFKAFEKWLSNEGEGGFGAAEDLPKMFDVTLEYEAKTFEYTFKKEFYGTLDAQECADNNITEEYEAAEYIQENYDSLYPEEGDVDDVETNEEGSETVTLQVEN